MVGAITHAGGAIQPVNTQQAGEEKTQPVATAGLEESTNSTDLVFGAGKGKFSDNEAFTVVAEASARPQSAHTAENTHSYSQSKYAKSAFDLFSNGQTGAQRQLQSLLTAQTLQSLLGFSAGISPEAGTSSSGSVNAGSDTTGTAGSDSGGGNTESSGGTDTGDDTGGVTDTGGTDTGGTTGPGNGNGKGHGKGGIKK